MFDTILLTALREVLGQFTEALPVLWMFAKTNPLFTALCIGALVIGGGRSGRRSVASRVR